MAAPPTLQEGSSQTRPPLFNVKYYGWCKNRVMDHLIGENPDLQGVILDGPTISMKIATNGITKIPILDLPQTMSKNKDTGKSSNDWLVCLIN